MRSLLLLAFLAAPPEPAPLRWVPVAFEHGAFLQVSPPELLTDLGRFAFAEGQWRRSPGPDQPMVGMLRPLGAAFLQRELTLESDKAAVELVNRGARLVVLRRVLQRPVTLELPDQPLPASSLRLLAATERDWLVQGVGTAGDARLGVFLLRIPKTAPSVTFVRPLGEKAMPAFQGALTLGDELWLLPDRLSERQDAWVFGGGRWRRVDPPTERSVLLDAASDGAGLWLAYSDGVLHVEGQARTWHALEAALAAPAWICPGEPGLPVQGRWVRGAAIVGWGLGVTQPTEDFPLDGQSCEFFTNASGTQALAAPGAVAVGLR